MATRPLLLLVVGRAAALGAGTPARAAGFGLGFACAATDVYGYARSA